MSNFANIRESIREAKASYDVGEHRIGVLHLDEALEEVSELERRSQATYELSKDYEALYEHLIGGGETLGRRRHSESSPRFPLFIAEDIRPMHVPFWHALVRLGKTRFVNECQKMDLEWASPAQPKVEDAYRIVREHEEAQRMEHKRKKDLPCPCCGKETDEYGGCNSCDVMLLDGCHRAQDCDEWHTHTNRCMVPYEEFALKHPGVTPREHSLTLLRKKWAAISKPDDNGTKRKA